MSLLTNIEGYYNLNANVNDSTPNAFNGMPVGTTTFANNGKIGKAITCDYTDNGGFSLPGSLETLLSGDFSYSFRVYFDDASNHNFQVLSSRTGGGLNILVGISNGSFYFYRGPVQSGPVTATLTISSGQRYHFVITQTGTTVAMYQDGQPLSTTGSVSSTGQGFGQALSTTRQSNGGGGGRIDEVGIRSRALTAQEASDLRNLGDGLAYPFSPTPVGTPTLIKPRRMQADNAPLAGGVPKYVDPSTLTRDNPA